MKKRNYLLSIGIMTGNSLDGADVVLSKITKDLEISDLLAYSQESPRYLRFLLQELRKVINENAADMPKSVLAFDALDITVPEEYAEGLDPKLKITFDSVLNMYTEFVASSVLKLIDLAKTNSELNSTYDLSEIDLIGFHGQTCAHFPPSIAKTRDKDKIYTVQIGDGQKLADLTGVSVVYDFRSDDLMHSGEGAPLAPVHHQHLAKKAERQDYFPLAFCNAGNTGNISVISKNTKTGQLAVVGFDTGPFNNYPDKLVQKEKGLDCDLDGREGLKGKVNLELLEMLFDRGVLTKDGDNFLLKAPPKSSDPEWYKLIPELLGEKEVAGKILDFSDRLRTAEYFSAYIYAYSLSLLAEDLEFPNNFAFCGGGWKNPLVLNHFRDLLNGENADLILEKHKGLFDNLRNKFKGKVIVEPSSFFGYDGTAMEARIFADAAVCRIMNIPFTYKETTGCDKDTVAGIIRFPGNSKERASKELISWLDEYGSLDATFDNREKQDPRWNRAVAGWKKG